MGKYSVPEEIRKLKPKGSVVKVVKEGYYVYSQKNIKDPITGKWKIKSGEYLGKITLKQGFVASKEKYIEETDDVYEFGQYAISYLLANEVKDRLSLFFDKETAEKIYTISLIHLVNGFSYTYKVPMYYESSFFYLLNPNTRYKETSLVTLYSALGSKRQKPESFEASLYENTNKLAIDGHCISSSSNLNDLAKKGNKATKFNSEQVNLVMGYDIDTSRPVFSNVVSGDQLDKISIKEIIETRKFKNVLYIVDKGFYNAENLKIFVKNDCHYIIPIQENTIDFKELLGGIDFSKDHFIYKSATKKTVIYYTKIISNSGRYCYAFRDLSMHALQADDYLNKVKIGKINDDKKTQEEIMRNFGTLYLMSDFEFTPEDIYGNYKKRWNIETYYNYMKNHLDYEALHVQDYYIEQGLSFIILVSSYIYYILKEKVKQTTYDSVDELLLDMRSIKLRKDNDIWHTTSTTSKRRKVFDDLNLDLIDLVKQINDVQRLQPKNHDY